TFHVSADEVGQRLDRVVAAHVGDLSRSRVQELIEQSLVLVNDRVEKAAHRPRAGDRVSVEIRPRPAIRAEAEAIPLDIVFEDDDEIAVNNPAGMTVHAGAGTHRGTLVNALLGRGQSLAMSDDALRPGIVHRLDKETSGIILVAKSAVAHARLGEAFRRREIEKTYIALVHGLLSTASGRIHFAIARDPKRRVRMTARRTTTLAKARDARTDWRALARIDATTLVEVQLHTGRTHQIRVHFSALRHPVVAHPLHTPPL